MLVINLLQVTGPGGLVSYGLLNTLYYTVAVSLAWVATGGGQSLRMSNELKVAASWTAAAKRFLKVRAVDRLASAVRQISDPGYGCGLDTPCVYRTPCER